MVTHSWMFNLCTVQPITRLMRRQVRHFYFCKKTEKCTLNNCSSTLWNSKILLELGNDCMHACNWPLWPYKPCKGNMMRNIFRNIFRTFKKKKKGMLVLVFLFILIDVPYRHWKGSIVHLLYNAKHIFLIGITGVCFLKWRDKISEKKLKKSNSCQYTQPPVSPTAVMLVTLLVSWPGRQYDEVSREVIPICSSDYFANSHLILPTTHQQGARERTCGSCSHKEGGLEEGQGRR